MVELKNKRGEIMARKKSEVVIDGEKYVKESCVMEKLEQGDESNPFMVVGNTYFIRTVTHYFTGRLIWVGEKEMVFGECAWIADTGRFNVFMAGGDASEVEPFPEDSHVIVGRGALVDMVEHKLVLSVK